MASGIEGLNKVHVLQYVAMDGLSLAESNNTLQGLSKGCPLIGHTPPLFLAARPVLHPKNCSLCKMTPLVAIKPTLRNAAYGYDLGSLRVWLLPRVYLHESWPTILRQIGSNVRCCDRQPQSQNGTHSKAAPICRHGHFPSRVVLM